MARLRVADVDAVEQDRDLVEGAAADADVGLDAHRAALAHVHADGVFEQVVDALHGGGADLQGIEYRHHPGGLVDGQGRARGAYGHFFNRFLCLKHGSGRQEGGRAA